MLLVGVLKNKFIAILIGITTESYIYCIQLDTKASLG